MKADHHILPSFLRQHLPAIRQLCIKHKVKQLPPEIDMVWYFGIKNPYFREEVDETKVLIYDPRSERVFV
ncbi:MAG: hypothetical protein SF052_12280 [Bacteroidia bacterium]|nr:hypothetical protein [Bacteroidia bacterium]